MRALKECANEGVEDLRQQALLSRATEGTEDQPAPGGTKNSASANGGRSIQNDGNVNFEFITEAPTAPESMLFGMFAWNIYAPLPWLLLMEPLLLYSKGAATKGQRYYERRGVKLLGGWACCCLCIRPLG